MSDNADKKLAAHQQPYVAQVEVGTGFVALDDVQAVAQSQEQGLADRYGMQVNVDYGAQQDEHVKAWREHLVALKRASE
jgi:hypothetical protein